MHLWVTGANGQIGSKLLQRLLTEGHEVTAFIRPHSRVPPCNFVEWDLDRDLHIPEAIPRPDVVVHLAGQTSAYVASKSLAKDAQTNIVGFVRLLDTIFERDLSPHIILGGSATELAPDSRGVTSPQCIDRPLSFYEVAKSAQRSYLRQCVNQGLITGTSLLFSNIYGGSTSSKKHRAFLNRCVKMALSGEKLTYYLGNEYLRDYTHVDDAVDAILSTAIRNRSSFRQFVVGTGRSISIRQVLTELATQVEARRGIRIEVVGVEIPIDIQPVELRNDVLDVRLTMDELGWKPRVPLEAGLTRMLDESDIGPAKIEPT